MTTISGLVPFLLGYRYTMDGTGTGFYVEPFAGYSVGASDIQKYDQYSSAIANGEGAGSSKK